MKSNSKKVAGSKEETIILDEQSVVKESDLLTRIVEEGRPSTALAPELLNPVEVVEVVVEVQGRCCSGWSTISAVRMRMVGGQLPVMPPPASPFQRIVIERV